MGRRRDTSGSDEEKGGKKRGGLSRIAKLGALVGAVALLKDSGRRDKVVRKGKGLVSGGKGAVAKAAPVTDRAGSLLGKAREGVSRLRNR
jgi:hypothetical protein